MQWAVTSASLQSQTKVARTFSQAHNVYRGIKAGVADSKAPRGHGRTAGDRSLLKGTSPQFKPVVAMWGCGLSILWDSAFLREPRNLDFHVKIMVMNLKFKKTPRSLTCEMATGCRTNISGFTCSIFPVPLQLVTKPIFLWNCRPLLSLGFGWD